MDYVVRDASTWLIARRSLQTDTMMNSAPKAYFRSKCSLQRMSRLSIAILCLMLLALQAIPGIIAAEKDTLPDSKIAPQYSEIAPDSDNCTFIGNSNTHKFHLPDCSWVEKIKPEHRVCFSNAGDAISAGYDSCKICHPMLI